MRIKPKIWITGFLILVLVPLIFIGTQVVKVDPFFHYHAPYIDSYYYKLGNERSQNNGIEQHFQYDAMITGTSMIENFKTSEMDGIFGTNSIKVPYPGATFKEINDAVKNAIDNNRNLKVVIRGLDMGHFLEQSDAMRFDLGEYPMYLYDDNLINDVRYIFNRNVIFDYVYPMIIAENADDFTPGITSFDNYSNWMSRCTFGSHAVLSPDDITNQKSEKMVHMTDEEKQVLAENIYQNVTSIAELNPDITFYYFFTPYSALWWRGLVNSGIIYKQIEVEEYVIETILQVENIKLYSFNNRTDITTDLNNYKDSMHYASWINSLVLQWMHDGEYLLTLDNYKGYLAQELYFYTTYDYSKLADQEDYENDYFAEALWNTELSDVTPIKYAEGMPWYSYNAGNAQHNLSVDDIGNYKYLVFYGKEKPDHEWPTVYIYNDEGEKLTEITADYHDRDTGKEWHQYLVNVSQLEGAVTIILDGEYEDIVLY